MVIAGWAPFRNCLSNGQKYSLAHLRPHCGGIFSAFLHWERPVFFAEAQGSDNLFYLFFCQRSHFYCGIRTVFQAQCIV
jgi:hypothetical protein